MTNNQANTTGGGICCTPQPSPAAVLAGELQKSPLYHIMKGQRELFHSNFIAWMFGHDKLRPVISRAFSELFKELEISDDRLLSIDDKSVRVNREKHRQDLLFEREENNVYKPFLIIENKVKDNATKYQLSQYSNAFPNCVKLTLSFDNAITTTHPEWKNIFYGNFASKLLESLKQQFQKNNSDFEISIAFHYASMISSLSNLIENHRNAKDLGPELVDFKPTFDKIRYSRIYNQIFEAFENKKIEVTASNFTFNTSNVEKSSPIVLLKQNYIKQSGGLIEAYIRINDDYLFLFHLQDKKCVWGIVADKYEQKLCRKPKGAQKTAYQKSIYEEIYKKLKDDGTISALNLHLTGEFSGGYNNHLYETIPSLSLIDNEKKAIISMVKEIKSIYFKLKKIKEQQ